MSADTVISEIRDSLNGRPGQPIVFGVCRALSEKYGQEPWIFRLAFIVLTLFWAVPGLAIYVVMGFALKETESRTRRFFCGLGVIVREGVQKIAASLRELLGPDYRRQ